MSGKSFRFLGLHGVVDAHGYVQWGGWGFELGAAKPELRAAIQHQTGI